MDRRSFLFAAGITLAQRPLLTFADDAKVPDDRRLGRAKDYNGTFLWSPPANKEAWERRRQELREQVLVANGLWPLPEKAQLAPVIHGAIDRDGYTIEKVFFTGLPGHYVSGNLYRPKDKKGKLPGVLCAHGHWANGRLHEATDKAVENDLELEGEKTKEGARYLMQALPASLARLGCIAFAYDMIGYADSLAIAHRVGFTDAEAELRLQSFMGLQTWNSLRALDFLLSLPDVDSERVGMTGASGGGTQTFLLGAIDDRLKVAVPAVMVSTGMQGGCICENCSLLRVETGNIELAGLFAPRPLALIGADDWTIDIETKGLPELRALYKLLGVEDRVTGKCFKQFKHNYNQVSREYAASWFNKHLRLGHEEPIAEKPFVPVPPRELSVFDEGHPLPKDALDAETLRKRMTEASDKQIAALLPKDAAGLKEFQRVVGTALRAAVVDQLPDAADVDTKEVSREERDGVAVRKLVIGRKDKGQQVPALLATPPDFDGTVVVWVHPSGKESLFTKGAFTAAAKRVFEKKAAILAPDVFMTGDFAAAKGPAVNDKYAGYTFGYNRTLLANRVHDILTAVAYAAKKGAKRTHLIGFEKAGPWVLLARPLSGDGVTRTAADFDSFRFEDARDASDERMLPGGLKYGGLGAFAATVAPAELFIHHFADAAAAKWLEAAYLAAGKAANCQRAKEKETDIKVIEWLLG